VERTLRRAEPVILAPPAVKRGLAEAKPWKTPSSLETSSFQEYPMDMPRPVSATSDIVFKYLFGSQSSTTLLQNFLNAVLADSGDPQLTELEITNPINDKQYFDDKLTIIDVRAKSAGAWVNVEIQVRSQTAFPERSLFYWAKTYGDQLDETDLYGKLKPVIGVNLLGFCLFPDEVPFHSVFQLTERHRPEQVLTDDCTLHYLELPKMKPGLDSELGSWLYALQHVGYQEDQRMGILLENNPNLTELAMRYKKFDANREARQAYEDRIKYLRDQANLLYTAEVEGRAKGIAEGLVEGKATGLAEGKAEGLAEGKAEGLAEGLVVGKYEAQLEIARRLKASGLSDEAISEATGLPERDLRALK
jgi:predicted transposase/invertase (TIGR01784 family)